MFQFLFKVVFYKMNIRFITSLDFVSYYNTQVAECIYLLLTWNIPMLLFLFLYCKVAMVSLYIKENMT